VIVTVADNGVGIEPDQFGQIFEAFHSTKGHKGTGLGLAVTKKVVEEHGGRITVASKAGAGTTFTVQLSSLPGGIPSSNDTQAR
jgi:two-component system, NtrC family, sensor kinase